MPAIEILECTDMISKNRPGSGSRTGGIGLVRALGLVGTAGTAETTGGIAAVSMGKAEAHEQHDQYDHRDDKVCHFITSPQSP